MKDAGGCEKLRLTANQVFEPEMSEWGNPLLRTAAVSRPEFIGPEKLTRGSETSQYPEEKKTMSDSRSSGERTGKK